MTGSHSGQLCLRLAPHQGNLFAVGARKAVKDVANASKQDSNAALCVNAVARTVMCSSEIHPFHVSRSKNSRLELN